MLDYKLLIFIKIQSKQEFSFTKNFKTIYPYSLLVGTKLSVYQSYCVTRYNHLKIDISVLQRFSCQEMTDSMQQVYSEETGQKSILH